MVINLTKIKEILLMNKGGIGPSSRSKMFTTTTVKGSHTLHTSGIDSFKDMALLLVLGLINISPTPLFLMIQYKGCREYSCVEDGINNVTLEHPTDTFQDELNPFLKLTKIMKLPSSHETV